MKKTKLLPLIIVIAITFPSFAQVKIGTNPTTIETTSNLEVEASTTGRTVKIEKTTGQVTIADGTQGAGKIFTSDGNGGGSWQASTLAGGKIITSQAQTFPNSTATQLITNTPMTITQAGNFLVSVRWWGVSQNTLNGITSSYFRLKKNGSIVDEIEYYVTGAIANNGFSFTLNLVASNCSQGDVLTIELTPATPLGATTIWKTGTAGTQPVWMPSILVSKI